MDEDNVSVYIKGSNIVMFLFGLLIGSLLVWVSSGLNPEQERPVVVSGDKEEWCLHGAYPFGQTFTINESKAGRFHYEVIKTQEGYEVWGRCI